LFNRVAMKCLEIEPEKRYQSALEILGDLEARTGTRTGVGVHPRGLTLRMPHFRLVERLVPFGIVPTAVGTAIAIGLVIAAVIVFRLKSPPKPAAPHAPVSVLVADFNNYTGDPIFKDTLEPMMNFALEGASFINAYNRGTARKLAEKLPHPTDNLDEQSARLVAVSQAISTVVTGQISLRGDKYNVSATALDAVTGNVLAQASITAANKDQLLLDIPKLAAPIRQALGDTTPESVQIEKAGGAFTAANLEAVHQYGVAMEEQFAGNVQGAFQSFSKAAQLDPNFARAYAGMAGISRNLGKLQDTEKYIKLAMEHVDRMTERERYRVRGGYYGVTGNWQKCVEEYSSLVKLYPADNIGQLNLAVCYADVRNMSKAVEAAQQAVDILPKGALQRLNLAFFSSYAGDFPSGEKEARKALELNPSSEVSLLALAEAELGEDQLSNAAETYRKMEKISAQGASMAASGLADIASYEGRYADAVHILEQGAAADLAAKNPENAANKLAALAHVQLLRGQTQAAVAAAEKALANSQSVPVRFLSALVFIKAGETAKAQKLASSLGSEVQAEPQSYAKIIDGWIAEKRGDNQQAVTALTDANKLFDSWISRFELGRAYVDAGQFVEADSEFDRCMQRRGEALELFMDSVPTYAYLPDVYYFEGRVLEGLKSPGFAKPYQTYLSIRGKAGEDPLLAEVRRRAGGQ
jgi:tetratricopeptide (TPR) repeat protein